MSDFFPEIAEKIESGEYFEDAKKWYQHKYIFPVIERSFYVFITFISVVASFISVVVIIDFFPLTKDVPIAIAMKDQVNDYARIVLMGEKEEPDSNEVVKKYLLAKYVKAREEYDSANNFRKLKRNVQYLEQFSNKHMLNDYKYKISVRNPKSFILRYKKHTTIKTDVNKRTFRFLKQGDIEYHEKRKKYSKPFGNYIPRHRIKADSNLQTAFVDFINYKSNMRKMNSPSMRRARIDFYFSDIVQNKKTLEYEPLNLKVVDYQIAELK